MSFLLQIDTALSIATVSFSEQGTLKFSLQNTDIKQHASFVQPAIRSLMKSNHISWDDVDAVCVNAGPGSYTGLRVGLAAAKGIAFALDKPLITINGLEVIALQAILNENDANAFYIPMIDARRMEVFCGIYDYALKPVAEPSPMVLSAGIFEKYENQKQIFCGNGAAKFQSIYTGNNALFIPADNTLNALSKLCFRNLCNGHFDSVTDAVPQYLKEFYNGYT